MLNPLVGLGLWSDKSDDEEWIVKPPAEKMTLKKVLGNSDAKHDSDLDGDVANKGETGSMLNPLVVFGLSSDDEKEIVKPPAKKFKTKKTSEDSEDERKPDFDCNEESKEENGSPPPGFVSTPAATSESIAIKEEEDKDATVYEEAITTNHDRNVASSSSTNMHQSNANLVNNGLLTNHYNSQRQHASLNTQDHLSTLRHQLMYYSMDSNVQESDREDAVALMSLLNDEKDTKRVTILQYSEFFQQQDHELNSTSSRAKRMVDIYQIIKKQKWG